MRTVWIWLAIAVVTTVAATASTLMAPRTNFAETLDEPAFPAMAEAPENAARIEVTTPTETMALVFDETAGWVSVDRGDYPASRDAIGQLLAALADMKLVSPRTSRPEQYHRLGLEALDADDAQGRMIRVLDADGGVMAAAIIGRRGGRVAGRDRNGLYIRYPDTPQTWLATGGLELEDQPADWLEDDIVDIPHDTLGHLSVQLVSGDGYEIERTAEGEPLVLLDPPEGRGVKADEVDRLGLAANDLTLADVRPAADFELPEERDVVRATSLDGLAITFEIAMIDGDGWATVAASAVPPADADAETIAGLEARAAEINARTAGWVYQLKSFNLSRLRRPLEDLLEPPPAADDGQG